VLRQSIVGQLLAKNFGAIFGRRPFSAEWYFDVTADRRSRGAETGQAFVLTYGLRVSSSGIGT
jgi:hypothetical protein